MNDQAHLTPLDTLATRYAGLRDRLPPAEQVVLDEACRDGFDRLTALRLRPGSDPERPMFLAMLVAEKRRVRDLQREVRLLREATQQLTRAVESQRRAT
jgi:hypothetical protein